MVVSFYETIFLQIAKQDFALNHIYAILSSMKTILHFPRNNEIRQLNSLIVAIDDKYGFSVKFATPDTRLFGVESIRQARPTR